MYVVGLAGTKIAMAHFQDVRRKHRGSNGALLRGALLVVVRIAY